MNKKTNQLEKDASTVLNVTDLSMLSGKTVMISGASGLIGTHLLFSLSEFIKRGNNIKKCYALIFSNPPEHLTEYLKYNWIEFLRGDITNNQYLDSLPNADFIIHAASYAQPRKFMSNASKVIKINTQSTFSLLDKLNKDGKFLFISSSAVYTGCNNLPFTEEDIGNSNTNHPRSGYIEGKRCGEAIVNSYRIKGIDAKSARLSLTYGPGVRSDDERVLNQFILKGLRLGSIDLLDDGSTEKVYLYISDAIELLWKILLFGKSDIYNVAGYSQTSIYQLAISIGRIINVSVNKKNSNEDGIAGTIHVEKLDTSKIKSEFSKTDYINLDEGLKRTILWMKEVL